MNENSEYFPLPEPYQFCGLLPSGFLSRTARITDNTSEEILICKSIPHSIFQTKAEKDSFIDRLYQLKAISSDVIIPYSNIFDTENYLLLIRPYIKGYSLLEDTDYFSQSPNNIINVWRTIAITILKLHENHIFPTLIKPNNIFYTENHVFITDLLPPPKDLILSHSPSLFDIGFLAPEFFTCKTLPSEKSDLWSLGVLAIYIQSHSLPWDSVNVFSMIRKISTCEIPRSYIDLLPDAISSRIFNLLQVEPANRNLTLESLNKSSYQIPKQIKNPIPRFQSQRIKCASVEVKQFRGSDSRNIPASKTVTSCDIQENPKTHMMLGNDLAKSCLAGFGEKLAYAKVRYRAPISDIKKTRSLRITNPSNSPSQFPHLQGQRSGEI